MPTSDEVLTTNKVESQIQMWHKDYKYHKITSSFFYVEYRDIADTNYLKFKKFFQGQIYIFNYTQIYMFSNK